MGIMRAALVGLAILLGLGSASGIATADETSTEPVATATTLQAPASRSGVPVSITITVTAADATVGGGEVTLERRVGGAWRQVADAVTGGDGTAQVEVELRR